jgi:hypothetical protein
MDISKRSLLKTAGAAGVGALVGCALPTSAVQPGDIIFPGTPENTGPAI